MKTIIWVIVVLIIAAAIILEFRYEFSVSSPVVAKFDRLTGQAWIVNAGVWRKIGHMEESELAEVKATPLKPPARRPRRKR